MAKGRLTPEEEAELRRQRDEAAAKREAEFAALAARAAEIRQAELDRLDKAREAREARNRER